MLESFLLTPWLVGDKIGMHPVAVIFAIMAGGQLFGFLGILLALPVAAVVMVVLRWLHARYTESSLYAGDGRSSRPLAEPVIVSAHDQPPPSTIPRTKRRRRRGPRPGGDGDAAQ